MTEITDEQRAAWLRLSNDPSVKDMMHKPGATVESDAALIAPLLPSELTNPQPALPTEPGNYIDAGGALVSLDDDGWHHAGTWVGPEMLTLPLTRLVPERPQITRKQIVDAFDSAAVGSGWDAVYALVNGADRD